jgi:cbb3-type cytochrome oxidase subunit 3
MGAGALGYFAFGAVLVALFAAIVAHYYARGRRAKIEEAKYRMLDDDEPPKSR